MRRFAFLGLMLLAFGGSGCPNNEPAPGQPAVDSGTPPPDSSFEAGAPRALTIVTWNVKNLYNEVRDSPEVKQADEIIVPKNEYQTKLAGIAGVLDNLGADIAILEEVENANVVADLAQVAGRFPHTHITEGNDPRGIDIAILSDHPLGPVLSHKDEFFKSSSDATRTFRFARDVLDAHLSFNGRHVALLGVHWKSGQDPDSQLKRLAEAEQTRRIATEIKFADPSAMVVVLGDFNDVPDSPPMTALAGAPPLEFVSATTEMPANERWSVTFGGSKLFDDQILDSVALSLTDRVFKTSVDISHLPTVDAVADHDPVRVTYQVK